MNFWEKSAILLLPRSIWADDLPANVIVPQYSIIKRRRLRISFGNIRRLLLASAPIIIHFILLSICCLTVIRASIKTASRGHHSHDAESWISRKPWANRMSQVIKLALWRLKCLTNQKEISMRFFTFLLIISTSLHSTLQHSDKTNQNNLCLAHFNDNLRWF